MDLDTHVTAFGNQIKWVRDGEFMRHVHMSLFSVTKMRMVYFLIVNAGLRRAQKQNNSLSIEVSSRSSGLCRGGLPPSLK